MESYRKGLRWLLRWLLLGRREQITHFHDFSARGGSCHGAVGRGWLVGETAHGVLPPPPPRPRPLLPLLPLGAEALPKAPGRAGRSQFSPALRGSPRRCATWVSAAQGETRVASALGAVSSPRAGPLSPEEMVASR